MPTVRISSRRLFSIVVLHAMLACGGGAGGDVTSPDRAKLSIVSGAGVTDTALAVLTNELVVHVTPATGSSAGLQVRFDVLPSEPTGQLAIEQTLVASGPTSGFGTSATVATDAMGQAKARIQFGSIPGETRVVVTCPQLAVTDTARFRIEPGPTARIVLSLRDTIMLAGSTFTVRAFSADQSGNATREKIAFDAGTNVLSVTDSGRVTTANVAGRGVVRVSTLGAVRDSVRFTSYVGGRVAFIDYANDAWGTLVIADIDGANPRILRSGFTLSNSLAEPAPHDDAVVYNQIAGPSSVTNALAALLLDVNRVERTVADPVVLPYSGHPRFGRDGEFVYFTGRTAPQVASAIWRVRRDGSDLERLSSPTAASGSHVMPGPSPDGRQLAYVDDTGLQLLALTTGVVTTIAPKTARYPAFSPDGSRLAFWLDGVIHVVKADGPGDWVATTGVNFVERPSWLPNSNWLLVRSGVGVELIEVTTGERTTLPRFSTARQIVSSP